MYKLLIVDDEWYAVEAIRTGIDWEARGFDEVLSASDADEAKTMLQGAEIAVMICDIEMPGTSGVELLEWVNDHSPSTVTIFLTGHADFVYAQQAVHLGSFDYLLKPVKYEQLEEVVGRAVRQVEQEKESKRFGDLYRKYADLSASRKPLLTELFWQDLFAGRIQPKPEQLESILLTYQVDLPPDTLVLPVMISIEHWQREMTERDEEILGYALRNAAAELLIPEGHSGEIIADRSGILFSLLYLRDARPDPLTELGGACRRYIEACAQYFYCNLSCYIGEVVPMTELANVYHRLLEMEHANVDRSGVVLRLQDAADEVATGERQTLPTLRYDQAQWLSLLEAGKVDDLMNLMETACRSGPNGAVMPEMLKALYHAVMGLVYQAAHQRGGSIRQIMADVRATDAQAATKTVTQFLSWARKWMNATTAFLCSGADDHSALIARVKAYMEEHLKTVTREEVAAYVYLNPAYLSRLFRKVTGMSLVDYLIGIKMNRAKMLLTESNVKISSIIEELGYENMSHFAKMFKKQVGMTPQEYRKRYQSIGKQT